MTCPHGPIDTLGCAIKRQKYILIIKSAIQPPPMRSPKWSSPPDTSFPSLRSLLPRASTSCFITNVDCQCHSLHFCGNDCGEGGRVHTLWSSTEAAAPIDSSTPSATTSQRAIDRVSSWRLLCIEGFDDWVPSADTRVNHSGNDGPYPDTRNPRTSR